MKIHLLQISVDEKNTERNLSKAAELFRKIEGKGIAVLPEMFIPGYNRDNMEYWSDKWKDVVLEFSGIAKEISTAVVFTTPVKEKGKIYNRAFFIDDEGKVLSVYDKIHLFRLMDEDKIFHQGNGLHAFGFKEWHIGMNICYDLRFPESFRKLWLKGANLIILPASWPFKRVDTMVKLAYARAIESQSYFVLVNRANGRSDYPDYGGNSMVISPDGMIVSGCGTEEVIKSADIDLSQVAEYRKMIDCRADRRGDLY
ncbi:MAG TPA: nitrilase-related carbon-nitrogen hydrolase [Clostridiales bacterium]|nr:nitrilase-related carbon-nitrogen hydrolase [Clostridiales bacterium]HQP70097.1 nitrilase-related carbon-nitrogen hydrolase [Clostridiales bacterium]